MPGFIWVVAFLAILIWPSYFALGSVLFGRRSAENALGFSLLGLIPGLVALWLGLTRASVHPNGARAALLLAGIALLAVVVSIWPRQRGRREGGER
ncbi:MAG: hypothetical protein JSR82_24225 [Verrucomicrobia bacterium]|nr:hypothetical protein [Verrucomicrobiota bacterium]